MRRLTALGLTVALGVAAALALASCGGEDAQLLPGADAREITANLEEVEQLASEGECAGAEDAAGEVSTQVETLQGVDEKLVRALERGATKLSEVVASCEETTTEALAPEPVPEPSESPTESDEKQREKEEKEREKEEEKAEKEEEDEDDDSEAGPPAEVPPPQSNGQGKGPDDGEAPAEEPSGGISPGDAVEEGEG